MKKYIIFHSIFFAMLAVLVGCKKSESLIQPQPGGKLESILKLTGDDQLTAFNMLNGEEKVAIHALHINKYVARKSFNASQKSLIDEVLQFNNSKYYDIRSDAKEAAMTYFAKNWLDRAKTQFSQNEIYTLAFSLDDIELRTAQIVRKSGVTPQSIQLLNQLNPDRSPYNNEALPNCYCSVGSSFTCPTYSAGYTVSKGGNVSVTYGACTYAYTQPCDVEGGCGFIGWSLCDGNRCA